MVVRVGDLSSGANDNFSTPQVDVNKNKAENFVQRAKGNPYLFNILMGLSRKATEDRNNPQWQEQYKEVLSDALALQDINFAGETRMAADIQKFQGYQVAIKQAYTEALETEQGKEFIQAVQGFFGAMVELMTDGQKINIGNVDSPITKTLDSYLDDYRLDNRDFATYSTNQQNKENLTKENENLNNLYLQETDIQENIDQLEGEYNAGSRVVAMLSNSGSTTALHEQLIAKVKKEKEANNHFNEGVSELFDNGEEKKSSAELQLEVVKKILSSKNLFIEWYNNLANEDKKNKNLDKSSFPRFLSRLDTDAISRVRKHIVDDIVPKMEEEKNNKEETLRKQGAKLEELNGKIHSVEENVINLKKSIARVQQIDPDLDIITLEDEVADQIEETSQIGIIEQKIKKNKQKFDVILGEKIVEKIENDEEFKKIIEKMNEFYTYINKQVQKDAKIEGFTTDIQNLYSKLSEIDPTVSYKGRIPLSLLNLLTGAVSGLTSYKSIFELIASQKPEFLQDAMGNLNVESSHGVAIVVGALFFTNEVVGRNVTLAKFIRILGNELKSLDFKTKNKLLGLVENHWKVIKVLGKSLNLLARNKKGKISPLKSLMMVLMFSGMMVSGVFTWGGLHALKWLPKNNKKIKAQTEQSATEMETGNNGMYQEMKEQPGIAKTNMENIAVREGLGLGTNRSVGFGPFFVNKAWQMYPNRRVNEEKSFSTTLTKAEYNALGKEAKNLLDGSQTVKNDDNTYTVVVKVTPTQKLFNEAEKLRKKHNFKKGTIADLDSVVSTRLDSIKMFNTLQLSESESIPLVDIGDLVQSISSDPVNGSIRAANLANVLKLHNQRDTAFWARYGQDMTKYANISEQNNTLMDSIAYEDSDNKNKTKSVGYTAGTIDMNQIDSLIAGKTQRSLSTIEQFRKMKTYLRPDETGEFMSYLDVSEREQFVWNILFAFLSALLLSLHAGLFTLAAMSRRRKFETDEKVQEYLAMNKQYEDLSKVFHEIFPQVVKNDKAKANGLLKIRNQLTAEMSRNAEDNPTLPAPDSLRTYNETLSRIGRYKTSDTGSNKKLQFEFVKANETHFLSFIDKSMDTLLADTDANEEFLKRIDQEMQQTWGDDTRNPEEETVAQTLENKNTSRLRKKTTGLGNALFKKRRDKKAPRGIEYEDVGGRSALENKSFTTWYQEIVKHGGHTQDALGDEDNEISISDSKLMFARELIFGSQTFRERLIEEYNRSLEKEQVVQRRNEQNRSRNWFRRGGPNQSDQNRYRSNAHRNRV